MVLLTGSLDMLRKVLLLLLLLGEEGGGQGEVEGEREGVELVALVLPEEDTVSQVSEGRRDE